MKKLLITLTCIIVNTIAYCQSVVNSDYVDSLVNYAMNTMPHAGLAIGIVKDNEIIHMKGYGFASVGSAQKADHKTLFAIASNTKAFTATALAILVDRGKINWQDKVVDHVPEFKMYNPYVTANFTIIDLLTHRSGLGLGAGDLMFIPDGSDFTIDDILKSFQYQKPVSPFRTQYDYDNLLYKVAGEVVKRVSGVEWNEFVEKEIMRVIDMKGSFGNFETIPEATNIAYPYRIVNNEPIKLGHFRGQEGSMGADGSVYSNVEDMCKWMKLHLNQGRYGDSLEKNLISKESHNELWKIHTNIGFSAKGSGYYNTHYRGYGLGFFISDRNGYTIIDHEGGLPGMLSSVVMVPELNLGIVILTNSDPGGYSYATISNQLLDKYTDGKNRDWIALGKSILEDASKEEDSVLTAVWNKVEQSKAIKIDKSVYIGTYRDNWFGDIHIYEENNELWFRSKKSPKLIGRMYYYQANTFAIDWEYDDLECNAFATFRLDENGNAQGIKMKGISPSIDFSFDFHDLDFNRISN